MSRKAKPLTPAEAVRTARQAAGLTQQQLAAACGCSPTKIRDVEQGLRPPTAELALRVAHATNTDPAAILPELAAILPEWPWSAARR